MDSLWDATRGSTTGRSTADQAKRSVLLVRMGVMMARSSEFKPVLRLIEWSLGSSRGEVSSNGSRRTSQSTLGSRSSLDRAMGGARWSLNVVGLLNWELWAQAGHVAFVCQVLVAVDGEDVTRRRRELHGQVGGGDDNAKGVKGRTAQESIVGCWRVDDKEVDWNGFGLGFLTKDDVEVDVAVGGYLFARKAIDWFVIRDHSGVRKLKFLVGGPVKDVNEVALVDKDFLNGVVFDFNSDDHGVILLMVEAMKVVICEDDGRHTASVVGMTDMVDGLDMAEVSLSGRRSGSSTSEATRDGVDGAT